MLLPKVDGYRWWTVGGGRMGDGFPPGYVTTPGWWLKLGPVSFARYRWFDGSMALGMCVLGGEERILAGAHLSDQRPLFARPKVERCNHHVFILGVIVPWKRYNPAYDEFEWSCGFGYWIWRWGRTPRRQGR